jgi:hypothetical protein
LRDFELNAVSTTIANDWSIFFDSRQPIKTGRLKKDRHEASTTRGISEKTEWPDRSASTSFLAIEQRPPYRDELEQDIVVADICSQHHQPELLRLQEQHAVLKRPQLAVFFVSLQGA